MTKRDCAKRWYKKNKKKLLTKKEKASHKLIAWNSYYIKNRNAYLERKRLNRIKLNRIEGKLPRDGNYLRYNFRCLSCNRVYFSVKQIIQHLAIFKNHNTFIFMGSGYNIILSKNREELNKNGKPKRKTIRPNNHR